MMDYKAYRKRIEEIGGDRNVHVKLGAIYETMEAIEQGDLGHAIILLRTMAAVDDRQRLREVRGEVYRRYRHALQVGDAIAIAEYLEQLREIDRAKSTLTA